MATSFDDIHSYIIQTNILPRLDGPSIATTSAVSSYLQAVSSDRNLWYNLCKSTWPSITDPRVNDVISTFPASHRSFFHDSFPALITTFDDSNRPCKWSTSHKSDSLLAHDLDRPSQLISIVEIRYQNNIIYSKVEFTHITTDFLSSVLWIELNEECPTSNESGNSGCVIVDADEETLSHLKEFLTLNWIIIDPTLKRAANLSGIKPVRAKQDWMTNETVLQYVTVLPGGHLNEPVECRIKVQLAVSNGEMTRFHVKKVILHLQGLNCVCLNGREFLIITQATLLEENNVRRKVMDDEGKWRIYKEFKMMKREKNEWVKKERKKKQFPIYIKYMVIMMLFLLFVADKMPVLFIQHSTCASIFCLTSNFIN